MLKSNGTESTSSSISGSLAATFMPPPSKLSSSAPSESALATSLQRINKESKTELAELKQKLLPYLLKGATDPNLIEQADSAFEDLLNLESHAEFNDWATDHKLGKIYDETGKLITKNKATELMEQIRNLCSFDKSFTSFTQEVKQKMLRSTR